jgi:hypothetical protein
VNYSRGKSISRQRLAYILLLPIQKVIYFQILFVLDGGLHMNKLNSPLIAHRSRVGFHYFPDTLHYTESDLQTWLPELCALKASWLVLRAEADRAIPERFITGLIKAGIEPIIHFNFPLASPPSPEQISPTLAAYARWGVRGVIFFDRPNMRSSWPSSGWVQHDLVERFLDLYLPLANQALQNGINPIFPPLEPGGSYWDTAFLRSALKSLETRKQSLLLQNLVLSAYAWSSHPSLDWGAGGPQRWPETRPYFTPADAQDQCGFRIFDWYLAITQAVLQKSCPIVLLGAGSTGDPSINQTTKFSVDEQTATIISIANLLQGEKDLDPSNPDCPLEPVPDQVVSCNFWLLSADSSSPNVLQAWYQADGKNLPILEVYQKWLTNSSGVNPLENKPAVVSSPPENDPPLSQKTEPAPPSTTMADVPEPSSAQLPTNQSVSTPHPINHYLLLPRYEWGIADWHLDVIRPFVKKYQPTVGFSLDEAFFARRVTVIGNQQTFADETLNEMRAAGCLVERVSGDGTSIATQLAER